MSDITAKVSAPAGLEARDPGTDFESKFDPITLSVLANRMDGICRQMTTTLLRSARSSVLAVAKDFSCSIISAENELIAAAEGLPVHVLGPEALARSMTDLHPALAAGDAFLHNDPYMGNTHHADHSILVPVFADGEHLFTVCAKAHQADCGNALPTTYMATAADIYAEGALNFPCVQVQRRYMDIADIIRIAQRRIRVPDQWYGDYLAGLGAARVGERALTELCAKYGVETVKTFIREWMNYGEWRMTSVIRSLPSGTWDAHTVHDAFPGMPSEGLALRAAVTVNAEAGRVEIDLRDNPDSTPNGMNQSETTARNNAIAGFCVSVANVPHNSGSFRPITVRLRKNCVAGIPVHPTSCSMSTGNVGSRIMNMIQVALAEAAEGQGLAEGANGFPPAYAVMSGIDRRDGRDEAYVTQLFLGTAGGPGGPHSDGWLNYLQATASGAVFVDSIEADEQKYPFVVHECRVRQDSEGAGWRRGAPGVTCVYGPHLDGSVVCNFSLDGRRHVPLGARGGAAGTATEAYMVDEEGTIEEVTDLVVHREVKSGHVIGSRSGGGGGYGEPYRREEDRVLRDATEGYISLERARGAYGVVIAGDPARFETFEIDWSATRKLRGSVKASEAQG